MLLSIKYCFKNITPELYLPDQNSLTPAAPEEFHAGNLLPCCFARSKNG
jgi:hypothetical protein